MKPASSLPWKQLPHKIGGRTLETIDQDDAYELHCANAYPRLVAELKRLSDRAQSEFTKRIKTEPDNWMEFDDARALLKKLGEEA